MSKSRLMVRIKDTRALIEHYSQNELQKLFAGVLEDLRKQCRALESEAIRSGEKGVLEYYSPGPYPGTRW